MPGFLSFWSHAGLDIMNSMMGPTSTRAVVSRTRCRDAPWTPPDKTIVTSGSGFGAPSGGTARRLGEVRSFGCIFGQVTLHFAREAPQNEPVDTKRPSLGRMVPT